MHRGGTRHCDGHRADRVGRAHGARGSVPRTPAGRPDEYGTRNAEPHIPAIIAHRGASGHAWENSLAAFKLAVELGADGVELDIHSTADGVLLVHHDPEVKGVGRIGDLPAAAFAGYLLPNGEPIPELGNVLEAVAGLRVWVEVKTLSPEFDATLLQTLDTGPTPDRYAVHGFDHRIVQRLGRQRPGLRRGVLLASYLLDTVSVMRSAGADTVWMETHLIDEELVHTVHRSSGQVVGWTANAESEIRRLVALGVDGICGNYPERIQAALG